MNTDNTTSASKAYTENWGVIVNPVAGKRHLRKEWINIYRTLKRAAIHFSVQSTEYPGHAILLTRDLLKNGFRRILIIGGDGTVNEVVNGIFTSGITDTDQVTIALIPYGTGNDWARYWGSTASHAARSSTRSNAASRVVSTYAMSTTPTTAPPGANTSSTAQALASTDW